ncbi:MAG TPA: hypothetical protein VKS21_10120, partial [Spirochaetota bacterium]|nr:hypothetical protein [Spirochaetota bacterium]
PRLALSYAIPKLDLKFDYTYTVIDNKAGMTHHLALSVPIKVKVKGVRATYRFAKKEEVEKEDEETRKKKEEDFFEEETRKADRRAEDSWSDE